MNPFFELLRQTDCAAPSLPRFLSPDEWGGVYEQSRQQALLGVMFRTVSRLPQEQLPPKPLLLSWYGVSERIAERNRQLNRACVALSERFRRDGFRVAVLKGQGLSLLYPDPLARMCGDIDLWAEGSREDIVRYVSLSEPHPRIVYHNVEFFLPDGTEVEVHFTPSWMNSPANNRRLQCFFARQGEAQWANEVSLPGDGGAVCAPALAFNRVYVMVHIFRHLFGEGIGLRQLMDYYYVLRQGFTEQERQETLCELERLRMLRFAGAVMYVLRRVFGLEERFLLTAPDEKAGRFLLSEVMQAGNFGHFDRRISHAPDETALSLFFHRSCRNFRFVRFSPGEALCTPLFKLWHRAWRKWHGYG